MVGDVFLKGGSPGHVVMVVDLCENEEGQKAFLPGQGYMPAQALLSGGLRKFDEKVSCANSCKFAGNLVQ